nr:nuclease-related domain-containing protein [uncultured Mogibacterium sp.]
MNYIFEIILLAIIVIILIIVTWLNVDLAQSEQKRAGIRGEKFTIKLIRETMRNEDILLCNVRISFEGKKTEIDNVILNKRGIYIIEVKNYVGTITGGLNDYEWSKTKTTASGNEYTSVVKNPINQVRRQVYLLANYLKANGINIWIEGYAFLVEGNSPIQSAYILHDQKDIDAAIHLRTNNKLSSKTREKIIELLS